MITIKPYATYMLVSYCLDFMSGTKMVVEDEEGR
jgi:hypothetical protein